MRTAEGRVRVEDNQVWGEVAFSAATDKRGNLEPIRLKELEPHQVYEIEVRWRVMEGQ